MAVDNVNVIVKEVRPDPTKLSVNTFSESCNCGDVLNGAKWVFDKDVDDNLRSKLGLAASAATAPPEQSDRSSNNSVVCTFPLSTRPRKIGEPIRVRDGNEYSTKKLDRASGYSAETNECSDQRQAFAEHAYNRGSELLVDVAAKIVAGAKTLAGEVYSDKK